MKTLIFVIVAFYGTEYPNNDQPRVMAKAETLEQCLFVVSKLNKLENTSAMCVVTTPGIEL